MKCIYCGSQNNFNKEHVIPQFLGSFFPLNPTITANDKLICQNCNSKIFSGLETEFKEDSLEGIRGQMLNFTGCNSIRIKGNNVKLECLSNLDDTFFNEIFPFLKKQDEKFVIDLKPQIKVRNYAGTTGYQIFLFDALKEIKRNSKKFEKIKKRIKTSGKNNIAVFTGGNNEEDTAQMDEIIALLKDYGINYNEKERKFSPLNQTDTHFDVNMTCTITPNICRFVAKVAFNYFVYCVLQEKRQSILYESYFDKIKQFILGDEKIKREDVIVEVSDNPITYHEKESGGGRFIGHIVVFWQENGCIYSKITFLGNQVYKVRIGEAWNDLISEHFGCGHLFIPFDHSIHNLTQQPKENPSEEEIKESFGLFRRLILGNN